MTHEHKKKIWIFYLMTNDNMYDNSISNLYAFTEDKKVSEEFKITRNMKKFTMKVVKLDRIEYNDLIRNYMNCELEEFRGYTKLNNIYKIKKISLPLTRREKIHCNTLETMYLHETLYTYAWTDSSIFKDKYSKSLDILLYGVIHDYTVNGTTKEWEKTVNLMYPNSLNMLLSSFKDLFIDIKRDDD